jgi:hypothetical protein
MAMDRRIVLGLAAAAALAAYGVGAQETAKPDPKMSFFITSSGPGDGANLGGLAGADRHCQALAAKVGAGKKTWKAYLSADAAGGQPAVNARDRIGKGPWYNFKGEMVARDVADLHSDANKLGKQTSLTETGAVNNGRGDTPNMHDILTGSGLDGTLSKGEASLTCANWTSNGEGSASLGHHDRQGGGANPTSWNSAHPSRGCSQANLAASGGAGKFYCFAAK